MPMEVLRMSQASEIADMFRAGQSRLTTAFAEYDGLQRFAARDWQHPGGGGGRSCILDGGRVFERAGVNVSHVHGSHLPPAALEVLPQAAGGPFTATGISLVLHPANPYAPSFHANFRYFASDEGPWWFGGGCDLTPAYGFDEDAIHFHRTLKAWCDRHPPSRYRQWKQACDRYYMMAHRGEMRGLGGIFFDRLTGDLPGDFGRHREFIADGLGVIGPLYIAILDARCPMEFGDRERAWQLCRRGRYVEFNLIYDRGTRFGLQTHGDIEAIFMSLPPLAGWGDDTCPQPGSPEADLARFLQPRRWA
jgi:coproporphyrinogen III oxidase